MNKELFPLACLGLLAAAGCGEIPQLANSLQDPQTVSTDDGKPRLEGPTASCAFGKMILNAWAENAPIDELYCEFNNGSQGHHYLAFYKDLNGRANFSLMGDVTFTYDPNTCELAITGYVQSLSQNKTLILRNPVLNSAGQLNTFDLYCDYCGPSTINATSCTTQAPSYL